METNNTIKNTLYNLHNHRDTLTKSQNKWVKIMLTYYNKNSRLTTKLKSTMDSIDKQLKEILTDK